MLEALQRRSATLVLYMLLQFSILFQGDQFACSTIEGKQEAFGDRRPLQVVNGKTGNADHEKEEKKENIPTGRAVARAGVLYGCLPRCHRPSWFLSFSAAAFGQKLQR